MGAKTATTPSPRWPAMRPVDELRSGQEQCNVCGDVRADTFIDLWMEDIGAPAGWTPRTIYVAINHCLDREACKVGARRMVREAMAIVRRGLPVDSAPPLGRLVRRVESHDPHRPKPAET